MHLPKTRFGIAAGIVAGSAGMALLAGLGPAQSLLPIASARGTDDGRAHAQVDDHARGADDGVTATTGIPATGTQVVDAAGAGTVTVAVGANRLDVVAATPATGFTARVEVASGREVEVEFRRGTQRVQVNLEIEDGTVRQRLRIRDAADGTDVRVENGRIVDDDGADDRGDDHGVDANDDNDDHGVEVNDDSGVDANEGPSANAGPGNVTDDTRVDNSGPGSGSTVTDDHGGHGTDDPAGDDHGGHGTDDPSGHH